MNLHIANLHVGRGTTRGSLTLFPLWHDAATTRRYSMDPSLLDISESPDGPDVGTLYATNTGKRPVLVLEGQLFEGGWQHRMATASTMVATQQQVRLDVACVEQGRWDGMTRQHSRGRRATPYVQAALAKPDQQAEVWRRVAQYVDPDNATGSLVRHLDTAAPVDRRPEHHLGLEDLAPLPGQTGILIGLGGQPYLAEIWDDPRSLREQFNAIIAAAAFDAPLAPPTPTPGRRVRRLIQRFEQLSLSDDGTAGTARRTRARSEYVDAAGVRWQNRDVHVRITNVRHPLLAGV